MHPPGISINGPFPVLTGPTASGKTALSLDLAERWNAEIISADSRQVFRELTIGTAKPHADERARVPHHFIDELGLADPFSAGTFAHAANERIRDIISRGRLPFVVGGSTLYVHALVHGLSPAPPTDTATRRQLETRLAADGPEALFDELQRADPASAKTLDPTKSSRLIRALEVLHATGEPLSSWHRQQQPPPHSFRVAVLDVEREILYRRIDERVDRMITCGLLSEVHGILDAGFDPGLNALRTIGYREAIAYFRGEIDLDEMIRLIKRNTRRYAKRQLTWFRRYDDVSWIPFPPAGSAAFPWPEAESTV